MPMPRFILPLVLTVTVAGCTGEHLAPAVPAPEVLLEGQEIAGVTPYPGPDSETRVENSRALLLPLPPIYHQQKAPPPSRKLRGERAPLPWQLSMFPLQEGSQSAAEVPRKRLRAERPEAALKAMLAASLVTPSRRLSRGAITIYPYEEGKVYQLTTSPNNQWC